MKHITKKRVSRRRKRGQVRSHARPRKCASVTRHRKKNKSRRGFYTKKRKVMVGGVTPEGWDGWKYNQKYDHVVSSKENWMNLDNKTKIQFINEIPGDLLDNTLRMVNYSDNSQNVVDAIIKRLSPEVDPLTPRQSETNVLNTMDLTRHPSSALPRPYLEPHSTPLPGSIRSSVAYEPPVSPQKQEPEPKLSLGGETFVQPSVIGETRQPLPKRPSRPPPPPPTLGSEQPSESIPPPPSYSPPPLSQSPPLETTLQPPEQNIHDVPIDPRLFEELKNKELKNKEKINKSNKNTRTVICDCTRSSTTPTPISPTPPPTSSLFSRAKGMATNLFKKKK